MAYNKKTLSIKRGDRNKTYVLLLFFWAIVIISFTAPDSLDLFRYYDMANTYNGSLLKMASESFDRNYDFIYITSLGICKSIGLPLDVATIIFVTLYFVTTLKITSFVLDELGILNYNFKLVACVVLSVPFVWVICVSRSVAGFCFLFYAICLYIQDKRVKAVLFAMLSVLTHFSMIIFIAIILLGIIITPVVKKIKWKTMILLVALSFLLTGVVNTVFSDVIKLLSLTFLADSRYGADNATYLDSELGFTTNFFQGSMYLGERAHTAVLLIFYMFLLITNKKRSFNDSVLLIGVITLPFFLFSIPHMVIRTLLFLTPFFSVLLYRVYYQKNSKPILYGFIIASIFCELWEFYNARLLF